MKFGIRAAIEGVGLENFAQQETVEVRWSWEATLEANQSNLLV